MNDEQHLLASVYLDGEATADERDLAESDPDVMSEVARLAALQIAVRDVEPPTASTREQAIMSAMAQFGSRSQPAPHVEARSTVVMTMRRRPAYARALSIAAALVAVAAFGLVVANRLGSDDDFDTAGSEAAVTENQSEDANGRLQEVTGGDTAETTADGDVLAAELAPSGGTDDAADATVAPMEAAADSAPPQAGDVPSAASGRPDIDPDQPLTTEDELGAYGTHLLEIEASGELGSTPNTRCPQQRILDETQYVFDGVPTAILVAVDTELRIVLGIDPVTCAVLVEGPLF